MTQPSNPDKGVPLAGDPRRAQGHRDTVLLSDIPDAPALLADQSRPFAPSEINLSPAALAALSQRYEILSEAGCGSMGNVYKARDRETGETVALKLLKPEIASDQAMMDRFKNELLFARKITHKNVCRLHEFNRIAGIAYTSMEFVEGESLRSVLTRFGGLPPRKAVDLSMQICSGLKEAHAQGIVHRDLKPENVMIDAQGNVKIMDFGIARSMEAGTRMTGSLAGTPAYMAPEQVGGKPVDYRTDIYSLGLILYEMFTGTPAFQADNPVAVALKQMRESPVPPRQVEPMIPAPIELAIMRCLQKEPARRFQSVGELETALRAPAGAMGSTYGAAPAMQTSKKDPVIYNAVAPKPEVRRRSPLVWLLQAAVLGLAAWGAWTAEESWFAAENLPAPPALPIPKAPALALSTPIESQPAEAPTAPVKSAANPQPADAKPVDSKSDAQPTAKSSAPPEVAPPTDVGPAKKSPAAHTQRASPPEDVQERADKAFGETGATVAGTGPTYLWVGRFVKEDRAQAAAKKIEDLGLPVSVIPRHGLTGQYFIVITGPFGSERISGVTEWLESQGFHGAHPVKGPAANSNLNQ